MHLATFYSIVSTTGRVSRTWEAPVLKWMSGYLRYFSPTDWFDHRSSILSNCPYWPIYQPFKEWWVIVLENNTEKKRDTLVKSHTALHFCTLMCYTLCSKIRPSCVDRSRFFCCGTRHQNPPECHLIGMLTFSVPHLKFIPCVISVSPGVFLSGRCLVS